MTTDLIAWLRAQLDEDERIAVDAALLADSERWTASARNGWDEIRDGRRRRVAEARNDERTHIARHDPARVLAEVEAKRRIIDRAAAFQDSTGVTLNVDSFTAIAAQMRSILRVLATAYADCPGYREEWRPMSEEMT